MMHFSTSDENFRIKASIRLFIYLVKILKTIQSHTPYKRGAEVKRIHVYKIYLQKYQGIKEI